MARKHVGDTKNGQRVFVETETSHAATHLKDTPGLMELVKEALPRLVLTKASEKIEHDFGRVIGTMDLVETKAGDDMMYAKRPNRDRYSRFIKNAAVSPCSILVLRFDQTGENEYDLYSTWIGRLTPSFPAGDGNDTSEEIEFWNQHALVWGTQEIVPGTETSESPW